MNRKIWNCIYIIISFIIIFSAGIAVEAATDTHTHTDTCYVSCIGIDYNGDGLINDYDLLPISYSGPGYSVTTWVCSACKITVKVYTSYSGGSSTSVYNHKIDYTNLICNTILTAITAVKPNQTIIQGNSLDATATATFSDGTPKL